MIDAQSIAGRVSIGEEARLEHRGRRGADARHEVAGVEGRLLDVCEVVVGHPLEGQGADGDEGDVGVGPHWAPVRARPVEG